jgi:hypothetical protein
VYDKGCLSRTLRYGRPSQFNANLKLRVRGVSSRVFILLPQGLLVTTIAVKLPRCQGRRWQKTLAAKYLVCSRTSETGTPKNYVGVAQDLASPFSYLTRSVSCSSHSLIFLHLFILMFPIRIASRTRFVYLQYTFRTGLRDLHHNAILHARVSKTKTDANNPPSTGSSAGSLGTPIKEKRSKTKSPITENASSTAGSQGAHVEKSSPRSKSRRPVNDGSILASPVEAKKKHTKRSAKKETTFEDVLVSSSGDKTRMNIVSESLSGISPTAYFLFVLTVSRRYN